MTQGEADGTAGRGGVVVRAVLDGRMGIHFPYLLWVGYGWIEYAAEASHMIIQPVEIGGS